MSHIHPHPSDATYPEIDENRKHSSRMYTAHLETVCVSVSVATTRCHSLEGGGKVDPQMNKIEQVSSDHHQMSLAGGRVSQRERDGIQIGGSSGRVSQRGRG